MWASVGKSCLRLSRRGQNCDTVLSACVPPLAHESVAVDATTQHTHRHTNPPTRTHIRQGAQTLSSCWTWCEIRSPKLLPLSSSKWLWVCGCGCGCGCGLFAQCTDYSVLKKGVSHCKKNRGKLTDTAQAKKKEALFGIKSVQRTIMNCPRIPAISGSSHVHECTILCSI